MKKRQYSEYPGDKIFTSFTMDPGAEYGSDTDFYDVATYEHPDGQSFQIVPKSESQPATGNITFSSLEHLEEFNKQLTDFIADQKRLKKD